jgi:hypothetical protein
MMTLLRMLRVTLVHLTLGTLGSWSVWAQLVYRTPSRYVAVVLAGIAAATTGLTLAFWLYAMFRGVGAFVRSRRGRPRDSRLEVQPLRHSSGTVQTEYSFEPFGVLSSSGAVSANEVRCGCGRAPSDHGSL